jgi:hypothetical protein
MGQAGPGTVVGERASLEGGRRTADLRAVTDAWVAQAAAGSLSVEQLSDLAQGHHREEVQAPSSPAYHAQSADDHQME